MGDEFKWLLKEKWGVVVFLGTLSLENRPNLLESMPAQLLKNPDIIDL